MEPLVTISAEPVDGVYASLLEYAHEQEGFFSLVWREGIEYDASAAEMREALAPDLVAEARANEWPGTRLLDGMATVRTYRLTESSRALLAQAGHLYAWDGPGRPEDLALYDSSRRVWLGSTAHERDAWLYADVIDPDAMAAIGLRLDPA